MSIRVFYYDKPACAGRRGAKRKCVSAFSFSPSVGGTSFAYKVFFGLALFAFFAAPTFSYAASIYFAPSSGSYEVGEQFSVNIFVSSDGQDINAAKATIESIGNNLQLVSVSQAGSIIDFWAREPQINGGGTVHFEGVLLGGGYSGSAGKLATVVLRARSVGDAVLSITSGSILANDGQGTELLTNLGTARFTITPATVLQKEEKVSDGFIFSKYLRQGGRGNEVSYLQICLRDQEFYGEDITGFFGTLTKQAVIDFQEAYRDDVLVPGGFSRGTGQVGESTRKKLNEVCFVAQVVEEPERPLIEEPALTEVITEEKEPFYTDIWFWVGVTAVLMIIIILLLLVIISLLLRRAPNHFERKHKQALVKEEKVLRQTHRQLLITKMKIEKDLQKAENKLKKFSKED